MSFICTLFIIWRQAFENDKYRLTVLNLSLYGVLQSVSIILGFVVYKLNDRNPIKLILTTFTLVPVILVSFAAFFGIWSDNDYNVYEKPAGTKRFEFFLDTQKLTFCEKLAKI